MNSRTWSGVVLALLVLAPSSIAAKRPNIVLIMADDIGIEGFSCYGGMSYHTPHIDQLAAQGVRFTHAYAQPLCTPTRVQIMTGKYNHRNWRAFGILDPEERTFAHLLKDAGYRTCIAGKWQLHSYDPPDFPNAARRRGTGMKVGDAGFDEYSLFHAWHTEDKGSRYANPKFDRNGTVKTVHGGYGPDTSVDFILDFMKRHQQAPLFVYYPMALPHWPIVPTPDSPAWSDPTRRLESDVAFFPDMVAYMDKVVGRLVEGIDELGLRDNTLILFYSDNGTDTRITSELAGKAVPGGKASPLQTGIRVPLIANWPGQIRQPRICRDLVDASDFLPTLAQLAETSVPEDWHCDGLSFVPGLLDQEGLRRDWCFFWYDPRPGWDKERFRRHIFALDHRFKLFSDGRMFDIQGIGMKEKELDGSRMSPEANVARVKLQAVIDSMMQPPMAPAAKRVVNAYGDPVLQ